MRPGFMATLGSGPMGPEPGGMGPWPMTPSMGPEQEWVWGDVDGSEWPTTMSMGPEQEWA